VKKPTPKPPPVVDPVAVADDELFVRGEPRHGYTCEWRKAKLPDGRFIYSRMTLEEDMPPMTADELWALMPLPVNRARAWTRLEQLRARKESEADRD